MPVQQHKHSGVTHNPMKLNGFAYRDDVDRDKARSHTQALRYSNMKSSCRAQKLPRKEQRKQTETLGEEVSWK